MRNSQERKERRLVCAEVLYNEYCFGSYGVDFPILLYVGLDVHDVVILELAKLTRTTGLELLIDSEVVTPDLSVVNLILRQLDYIHGLLERA